MSAQKQDWAALVDAIEIAVAASGAPDTVAEETATALDTKGYKALSHLAGWAGPGGVNALFASPLDAPTITKLGTDIIAWSAGAIADDIPSRAFFAQLAMAVRHAKIAERDGAHQHPLRSPQVGKRLRGEAPTTAAAAPVKRGSEDDEGDTIGVYRSAEKVHGRATEMSQMCTFVVACRKSIDKHGHPQEVPELTKVAMLGRSGSKRPKEVGSTGDGVTLELKDTGRAFGACLTLQHAHERTRSVLVGLRDSSTVKIGSDLFGGREVGWYTVPGEAIQTRLMMTPDACERLILAFVTSPITVLEAYVLMFYLTMQRMLDVWAQRKRHPDEIIDHLIDMEGHRFREVQRGGVDTATLADLAAGGQAGGTAGTADTASLSSGSTPGSAGDLQVKNALCNAWLTAGSCSKGDACPFGHAPAQAGALAGQGRSAGALARNNRNRDYWSQGYAAPSYYPPPPWGGKGGGKGANKGGGPPNGKGNGRKGKGAGKGGGGPWDGSWTDGWGGGWW